MNGRNVFEMDYLVVPYNAGGIHWVCLVVNLKTMNVWCVPCHAQLCVHANAAMTLDLCVVARYEDSMCENLSGNPSPAQVEKMRVTHALEQRAMNAVSGFMLCHAAFNAHRCAKVSESVSCVGSVQRLRFFLPQASAWLATSARIGNAWKCHTSDVARGLDLPQQPNGFDCGLYMLSRMASVASPRTRGVVNAGGVCIAFATRVASFRASLVVLLLYIMGTPLATVNGILGPS
jgi:hypothetical protein